MLKRISRVTYELKPTYWLDTANYNSISSNMAYQNLGVTGSGTSGTSTITASGGITLIMFVGQTFRIGSDEYIVSGLSGTTITTTTNLTTTYTNATIQTLKVSQINDSSGNAANVFNSTSGAQPSYVINSTKQPIGQPGFGFDTNDDALSINNQSSIQDIFASGGTFVGVVTPRGTGPAALGRIALKGWSVNWNANSGLFLRIRFAYPATVTQGIWDSVNFVVPIGTNTPSIIAVTFNASSISTAPVMYCNSTTPISVTVQTSPVGVATSDSGSVFYVGNVPGLNRGYDGIINEIALWKRVLSAAELSSLFYAMSKKYNITLT
jgi:hypothetical protein